MEFCQPDFRQLTGINRNIFSNNAVFSENISSDSEKNLHDFFPQPVTPCSGNELIPQTGQLQRRHPVFKGNMEFIQLVG
tara:strand:+ start:2123 stop:2359 length:237 start_codon:yes stop_codon:yes gene_type:complete